MKRIIIILAILLIVLLFPACTAPPVSEVKDPGIESPEDAPDTPDVTIEPEKNNKPAKNPDRGKLQGYGDDGIAEMKYDTRNVFEQSELPRIVFEYEKEMIEFISVPEFDIIEEMVMSAWRLSAALVIVNDFDADEEEYARQSKDRMWELIDKKVLEFDLGYEQIVDITIDKLDEDTNAVIVKMADTDWMLLSAYIGIVYNKTAGLKYYTLERTYDIDGNDDADKYMLCYVEPDARGSFYLVDNDKKAFTDALLDVLEMS